MLGQKLRSAFADHSDAESVDHALERKFFRILNFVENVLGRLVGKSIEAEQIFLREVVNVGDIFYQTLVDQLSNERFAHSVDVHDTARGEMEDRPEQLGWAVGVDAAVIHFALGADDLGAAYRTFLGHDERLVPARTVFVCDDLGDFRDNVAAPLDLHPVADFHAQALDLIHIVQRGIAHRGAADQHWGQFGDWREFPGAADLHANAFDLRDSGARCIFIGDGPARSLAGEAEFVLQAGAIHFDDDAIDL